jgi:DNA-binding response OmpR family regulator
MTRTHLVVVADDDALRTAVQHALVSEGHQVRTTRTADAPDLLGRSAADLLLLEIAPESANGWLRARELVGARGLPTILLAGSATPDDRVRGLELGADDFLVAPFHPQELAARVRSVLRRSSGTRGIGSLLLSGDLVLDLHAHGVSVSGRSVQLTAREFDLLVHLAQHPGVAFTRQQLLSRVWGEQWIGAPAAVTVVVRRLRTKIESDPSRPLRLVTLHGVGYRLLPVSIKESRVERRHLERRQAAGHDQSEPFPGG